MTQTTQPQQSEIMKLRTLAVPKNYREVVSKIFDKKLKSYLTLSSKEEVLQSCQELLITKTIDYMNLVNDLEFKQLTTLNSLNTLLDDKGARITELQALTHRLEEEIKEKDMVITLLTKDLTVTKKELEEEKDNSALQLTTNTMMSREHEKSMGLLTSEYFEVRSKLQASNSQLIANLDARNTELKSAIQAQKEQVGALKLVKEKETMEFNRKLKDVINQHRDVRQELMKDKRFLQDLVEVKEDQITEAKKPKVRRMAKEELFSYTLKLEKDTQKEKEKEKENQREREKERLKQKQREREREKEKERDKSEGNVRSRQISKHKSMRIGGQTPSIYAQSSHNTEKLIQKPVSKQIAIQCGQPHKPESLLKAPIKKEIITISTFSQTVPRTSFELEQPTNEVEIRMMEYMEEKYRILCDQKSKEVADKMSTQYKESLSQVQLLAKNLAQLTNERISVVEHKLLEMEDVYFSRPSREEDLAFIQDLLEENQSLTNLCNQANRKTDSAYMALQEYHTKLQSYKRTLPMNVYGIMPPQNHSLKEIRDSKDYIRDIRETKVIKNNNRMHTTASFNFTESKERRRSSTKPLMDDMMETTMKEVMVTEYDSSDFMFSPARKRRSRPESGANILGLRKRSVI